jgi:hypothetical protein
MIRTFARRVALAAVPLVTLPAIMLAATPGPALASAPPATIHFTNQAPLQADGSVLVTVVFSCPPSGGPGILTVDVEEGVNSGFLSINTAGCNDRKQTMTLDISGPFRPGDAAAFAQITIGTISASTQTELKVK